jgi:hypothetical protein
MGIRSFFIAALGAVVTYRAYWLCAVASAPRFFTPLPHGHAVASGLQLRPGAGVARVPALVLMDPPPSVYLEPGAVNAPGWVLPVFSLLIAGLPLLLLMVARVGSAASAKQERPSPLVPAPPTPHADEGVVARHPAWVQVLPTRSKGNGLFCRAPIPRGSFLFDYEGERIDEAEYRRRYPDRVSDYAVGVKKTNGIVTFIDAVNPGLSGLARYMNHSAARPNVKMQTDVVANPPRVLMYATKDIEPGDELVWNYGIGYVQAHPNLVEDDITRRKAGKAGQSAAWPPTQPAL